MIDVFIMQIHSKVSTVINCLKYIPGCLLAIMAVLGFLTCKIKTQYERKMIIIDSFHDAVTEFVMRSSRIIIILQHIIFWMNNYPDDFKITSEIEMHNLNRLKGFIENHGEEYSLKLINALNRLPTNTLQKQVNKIKVIKLNSRYIALGCNKKLTMFNNIVDRVAWILGLNTLSWEDGRYQDNLSMIKNLDLDELRAMLSQASEDMLNFCRKNY